MQTTNGKENLYSWGWEKEFCKATREKVSQCSAIFTNYNITGS